MAAMVALFACSAAQAAVVVCPATNASPVEKLAARELQRYIYVRTGTLPATCPTTIPKFVCLDKRLREAASREGFVVLPRD